MEGDQDLGKYNFDQEISRKNTSCLKYDFALQRTGRDDLLPMWVADMDFRLPDEILQPVYDRVRHGIFGYTDPDQEYFHSLADWFAKRYGWQIDPGYVTVTPGVVYALAACVRTYTSPGDAVIIQEPVYYPFREVIEDNGRRRVNSQLIQKDGKYEIDFQDFENKIIQNNVKLFILCSPHNPVGRVWTREELTRLSDICLRHGVKVVADEIHCDFIWSGVDFVPYSSLEKKYLFNAVICTSASKTFNIAGLQTANIFIPDKEMRQAFRKTNAANGYSQPNALGLTATQAAYTYGEEWLEELKTYIEGNITFMEDFLHHELPELIMTKPEGTYLVWVDFSNVVQSYGELKNLVQNHAHLWLDDGAIFGEETSLFERFNLACPRKTLQKALNQLKGALQR